MRQLRGNGFAFIGFPLHLIDIPIGGQQAGVDWADIRAIRFNFLGIPQGKGIVVPNGKNDSVFVFLNGGKVGLSNRLGSVATRTIVIVPVLIGHQKGNGQ